MEKRLRIAFTELSRMVFECSCGTEVSIDTGSAYPNPQSCPSCGALFEQQTVGLLMTAFRDAFRKLSKLSENNSYPRIIFCVKPKSEDLSD